jgi:hypothetical protein
MQHQSRGFYVLCPVCHSKQVTIDDQDRTAWLLYELTLCCDQCDATWTAHYECYEVRDVRYGNPIGPVCLTDDPQQALAAWQADEHQWILTDGSSYAIGYEPTLLGDGRKQDARWRDCYVDELEALLAQAVRP